MENSGNKRMIKIKGSWKHKVKPCDDLEGDSDEMTEEIELREKKRWKHLELEFIHQEQTPKEGITHLDEIRIRFIVCLSFIKLNWWQTNFAYYLFFLKKDWEVTYRKLEKVFMNHR